MIIPVVSLGYAEFRCTLGLLRSSAIARMPDSHRTRVRLLPQLRSFQTFSFASASR